MDMVSKRIVNFHPAIILLLILAFFLSSCESLKNQLSQSSYTGSCLKTGVIAGLGTAAYDFYQEQVHGKKRSTGSKLLRAGVGAVAGCAVGLAVTAVGKSVNRKGAGKAGRGFSNGSPRRVGEGRTGTSTNRRSISYDASSGN